MYVYMYVNNTYTHRHTFHGVHTIELLSDAHIRLSFLNPGPTDNKNIIIVSAGAASVLLLGIASVIVILLVLRYRRQRKALQWGVVNQAIAGDGSLDEPLLDAAMGSPARHGQFKGPPSPDFAEARATLCSYFFIYIYIPIIVTLCMGGRLIKLH